MTRQTSLRCVSVAPASVSILTSLVFCEPANFFGALSTGASVAPSK